MIRPLVLGLLSGCYERRRVRDLTEGLQSPKPTDPGPSSPPRRLGSSQPLTSVLTGHLTCAARSQATLRLRLGPFLGDALTERRPGRGGEESPALHGPRGAEEGRGARPGLRSRGRGGPAPGPRPLRLELAESLPGEGGPRAACASLAFCSPLAMATRERGQDAAVSLERGRCCLQAAWLEGKTQGRRPSSSPTLDTCPSLHARPPVPCPHVLRCPGLPAEEAQGTGGLRSLSTGAQRAEGIWG